VRDEGGDGSWWVACEQIKAMHKNLPMMSETLMRVAADMASSWDHKCPRYLWPMLEGHNRLLGDANGWLGHTMCMRQQCVPPTRLSPLAVPRNARVPTETSCGVAELDEDTSP
jgi:hypothetical protein